VVEGARSAHSQSLDPWTSYSGWFSVGGAGTRREARSESEALLHAFLCSGGPAHYLLFDHDHDHDSDLTKDFSRLALFESRQISKILLSSGTRRAQLHITTLLTCDSLRVDIPAKPFHSRC
jgi:hypothetical protein